MEDDEQIAVEPDHDALAEPLDAGDARAKGRRQRRIDAAQEERAPHPHALKARTVDTLLKCVDVGGDVGQLGHGRHAVTGLWNVASVTPPRLDFRAPFSKWPLSYPSFGVPLLSLPRKTGRLRSIPKNLVGKPPREWSCGATGVFWRLI